MDEKYPEQWIGDALNARGWKLATAESCTGGLVGHLVTNQAGSSGYFLGGVVSYSNALKIALLGVLPGTLEAHGAVSKETAVEMARGARERLGADIGLSVTGIAGPGGGTAEKPVGLTFIGLSGPWGEEVREFRWQGGRERNKIDSARAALAMLLEALVRQAGAG